MANEQLTHDAAVAMSQAILDLIQAHLPYEERLKAVGYFYLVCKSGIEVYEEQKVGVLVRLAPMKN